MAAPPPVLLEELPAVVAAQRLAAMVVQQPAAGPAQVPDVARLAVRDRPRLGTVETPLAVGEGGPPVRGVLAALVIDAVEPAVSVENAPPAVAYPLVHHATPATCAGPAA